MSHIQKAHAAKAIHSRQPLAQAPPPAEDPTAQPDPPQAAQETYISAEQHHIVALEAAYVAHPTFPRLRHTYTAHARTAPHEVAARLQDATIAISIMCAITPADAATAPRLKLIVVLATGHSWVDAAGLAAHGVTVINCPGSNIPAVAEHAVALYFAARRRVVTMHDAAAVEGAWPREGTLVARFEGGPPLSCAEECVGVVGYGALGRRVEGVMRGVGMGEVLVAERRGVGAVRDGRVAFGEVVRRASVLVVCCPKDASTVDLLGEHELKSMRPEAVVINVARGGIVNEAALAKALRERWIAGAAMDVLEAEPAGLGDSPLLPPAGEEPVPNLTVSPHIAWLARRTITTLQKLAVDGVEAFVVGRPIHVIGPSNQ